MVLLDLGFLHLFLCPVYDAYFIALIADVFGKPVLRPQACDASFGSALLAGVGIGIFKDQRTAVNQCLSHRDPVLPNAQNQAVYEKAIQHYYRIHDVLADVYHDYAQD